MTCKKLVRIKRLGVLPHFTPSFALSFFYPKMPGCSELGWVVVELVAVGRDHIMIEVCFCMFTMVGWVWQARWQRQGHALQPPSAGGQLQSRTSTRSRNCKNHQKTNLQKPQEFHRLQCIDTRNQERFAAKRQRVSICTRFAGQTKGGHDREFEAICLHLSLYEWPLRPVLAVWRRRRRSRRTRTYHASVYLRLLWKVMFSEFSVIIWFFSLCLFSHFSPTFCFKGCLVWSGLGLYLFSLYLLGLTQLLIFAARTCTLPSCKARSSWRRSLKHQRKRWLGVVAWVSLICGKK